MQSELLAMAKQYPVVTLIGPRQSGKTTLVRACFPEFDYINLEKPDVREWAEDDPNRFFAQFTKGVILDEIQRVPKLLSYIQVIVDEKKQPGLFILTGSHQLALHQAITQSLAGRTALLKLLPLTIAELNQTKIDFSLNDYLLKGFFPQVYQLDVEPTKIYRNYYETYIEKDVRQLINVKDLSLFNRFVKLCAGRVGQIFNASGLSNDLGVSSHTVKQWLSILEASFILFRLEPYFENFGKRVIKSPKYYFIDVGLLCYLLGIENATQIERDPLRGNIVENLVILELFKTRYNLGLDPNCYFFRDNNGNEVDLIYKSGTTLIPVEIKAAQTIQRRFYKNIEYFEKIAGELCQKSYLVYTGELESHVKNTRVLNYKHVATILTT